MPNSFEVVCPVLSLDPGVVGDMQPLPFRANAFDVACAFQVLEHVPYPSAVAAFSEMARVASHAVVLSMPDARPAWVYSLHIPTKGDWKFYILRPWCGPRPHKFDGQHYWELNKSGYRLTSLTVATTCVA